MDCQLPSVNESDVKNGPKKNGSNNLRLDVVLDVSPVTLPSKVKDSTSSSTEYEIAVNMYKLSRC